MRPAHACSLALRVCEDKKPWNALPVFLHSPPPLPTHSPISPFFPTIPTRCAQLRQHLSPHQVPLLGKALMSHNLLAASKIYDNITFAQLSTLLGVRAEEVCNTSRFMAWHGMARQQCGGGYLHEHR